MKVIIAGSRNLTNYDLVLQAVKLSGFDVKEVVSGAARGVDSMGERWATENGIPIKRFPADWNGLGKGAGFARNIQMANYADGLIAVTTGSPGTRHMILEAQKRNLEVFIGLVQ